MSWETVRNFNCMPPLLLIIRNLCCQGKAPGEVMDGIENMNDIVKEVLEEYPIYGLIMIGHFADLRL